MHRFSILPAGALLCALLLFSCTTTRDHGARGTEPSRNIAASGTKTAEQLTAFFLAHAPNADSGTVYQLASYYIEESQIEGINSDAAFVQMCLETGFLSFGGLVTPDMHNYCGLGAIDASRPGERFPTMQTGVRAHIQHLQAYATQTPLKQAVVDPRYKYVQPRGKAPTIYALSGTWAADREYGQKLDRLLTELARY
ncbi:MAG TPA: glucosaminidase domain-containing protein [Candidatus Treponema faecavium]|nr:glucosaminidase domain-containing protein [Candidatus Treponema faecavium]